MVDTERDARAKERTILRRDGIVARIRHIHQLASSLATDQAVRPQLAVAIQDLDALWASFEVENNGLLSILSDLDLLTEFPVGLDVEVRSLVVEIKAVWNEAQPASCMSVGTVQRVTYETTGDNSSTSVGSSKDCPVPYAPSPSATMRLPEIPLPYFDGECQNWPAFRDLFGNLVANNDKIPNVTKFYYLVGCLHPDPQEVIKGFSISNESFTLAWDALVERYDKPRRLASSIIDKLINAPVASSENHAALQKFLSVFDENIAILESLQIPDLSSFLLFSLAARCLPTFSRRQFESENNEEYPSIQSVIKFVKARIQVIENAGVQPSGSSSKPASNKKAVFRRDAKTTLVATNSSAAAKPTSSRMIQAKSVSAKCFMCSGAHQLADCSKFKALSVDERYKIVCTHRLCMVCFGEGHMSFKCSTSCATCKRRHHALLHRDSDSKTVGPPAAMLGRLQSPTVLLGTALVQVQDTVGSCRTIRALVDSASQISAITSSCCERLGLKPSRWTVPVTGLSGQRVPDVHGVVQLKIQPRDRPTPSISVKPWVLSSITTDMPARQLPAQVRARCSHLTLADPSFDKPAPVDMLIGADIFPQVWNDKSSSLGPGFPSVYSSVFGWVLIGPVQEHPDIGAQSMLVSLASSMEALMERFWLVEEPDAAPQQFTEDGLCEELFHSEVSRDSQGRFSVPLPFRSGQPVKSFPGSRQVALNRFLQLERRLAADSILYAAYRKFMSEYEELGHMTRAEGAGQYYIPHHAVQKVEGDDVKLRVVFDASAKCHSGMSLNQCLLVGPKLQQDIVDVLVGFRVHKVAFTTDICKMYRQIEVLPQYRGYQYILWRESPQVSVREYALNTVTYGVNSAPYLALRVLRFIADTECADQPDVKGALYNQTYMDDICVGAESLGAAKVLQSNLIKTLARSGLQLRKWASNSPELLDHLLPEDRSGSPLTFEQNNATHVLGMLWNHDLDYFSFTVNNFKLVLTKRGVLSMIARIFDPLGMLSPTIFYAKTIMQRLWLSQVGWDSRIPSDIADDWCHFYHSLGWLVDIQIPRYIGCYTGCSYILCGFCDASEKGYAAVAYLRVTDPSGATATYLLGAKTKLAPMKTMTTPRLELSGALLLASWLARLKRILEFQLGISDVFAWSDSSIVLSWLNIPHTSFKTFVSNRIYQIQSAVPGCHWQHVRSEDNPADCASRGLLPDELRRCKLYWRGPTFLQSPVEAWSQEIPQLELEELPEVKPVCLLTCEDPPVEWFIRFSSFHQMIRVLAQVRRFIRLCQRRKVELGFLKQAELDEATLVIVRSAQNCYLSQLVDGLRRGSPVQSKALARLCPFLDSDGIIRVGGRMQNSNWSERRKHPMLVPKESHLAVLITRHWHLYACHARPRLLIALVQQRFWVIGIRLIVHRVIRKCVLCAKMSADHPQPIMAALPGFRVREAHPFSIVGIDYAGPLQMKELSLRKARIVKVYIAVFVCMTTKAVHLEPVSALSTEAFLLTLDRFVGRRGLPSAIYSDCGTNFVGAARQLRQLVNSPDSRDQFSGHIACEWHFNPPGAPHFGGIWEAAVKSAKSLLVRAMNSQIWTLEEFSTVLCRVEAALNSRPLIPASSDPNDLECLTPGHFLIGRPLLSIPEPVSTSAQVGLRTRWKLLQQSFQFFWRRWSREYLNTLQARGRWTKTDINLEVGTMVIVKVNDAPPLSWPLGRIIEVYPGTDKVVRVAKVITKQGVFTRPVVKLVPLPTDP
ncbi:unnamed protein product [Macrosiphum euphorbiae]|uniref:Integrase catalytic domain-containing protein n=1 Tax=Macrosiphum euphorbiae TaxID=13131 RepID=A0AAV0X2B8_9HEMI|nr:unnamed protein product [Macrosiphum euphorbiae]